MNYSYLLAAILFFASFLQPQHFLPWTSWHSEVAAFCAVVVVFGGVTRIFSLQTSAPIGVPKIAWVFVCLAAIVALQTYYGVISFFGDGLVLEFYLLASVMALSAGFLLQTESLADAARIRVGNPLEAISWAFLLVAVLSTLICWVQVLGVWDSATWVVRPWQLRRPGGNVGQPNQLATLLLMGVAGLVYLFEARRLGAIVVGILLALLLMGVALTESRTGLLTALCLAAWWCAKRGRVGFRCSFSVAVVSYLALLVLMWFWPSMNAYIQEGGWTNNGILGQRIDVSTGTRLVVWPQLIEAVLQRPWLGWGLREVSEAHNAVLDRYVQGEPFSYAHNIVLDLAVGAGLPATMILGLVAVRWAWRRMQVVTTLLPWTCIALTIPLAVHSMLEFPFSYAYFLFPVLFVIGMLESMLAPQRVFFISRRIFGVVFVLFASTLAWSAVEYVAIEEDFRVVRFESMSIGQTPPEYVRPHINLLTQLDALLKVSRYVPTSGMLPDQIELSRKVAMRFPWTATQNRYALSLALNGNPQEALRQLKVMRAMHGEKTYEGIKANWKELAESKFPQLGQLTLP